MKNCRFTVEWTLMTADSKNKQKWLLLGQSFKPTKCIIGSIASSKTSAMSLAEQVERLSLSQGRIAISLGPWCGGLRHCLQLVKSLFGHYIAAETRPHSHLLTSIIPAFVSFFSLVLLQPFYGMTAQPVDFATALPCGDCSPIPCAKCVPARCHLALIRANLFFPANCVSSPRVPPRRQGRLNRTILDLC